MKLIYVTQSGNTGYVLSAKQYILALLELGVEIQWFPTKWTSNGALPADADRHHPELHYLTRKVTEPDLVLLHLVPSEHNSHLPLDIAPTVAYTTWETDRLPPSFLPPLDATRSVLVPSSWNQDVFQASGVSSPVHVVPHLLEKALEGFTAEHSSQVFTFYSIAPWTDRKALPLMVEAFCRAFTGNDNVRLILKTTKKDCTKHSQVWALRHVLNNWHTTRRSLQGLLAAYDNPPNVQLVHEELTREDILGYHKEYHCYLLLSRGEGWGLGAFEAAAAGVPVIATNYGGPLDYLDPSLSHLVDYRIQPCEVSCWEAQFTPDQKWAEPAVEHAVDQMRCVYDNFEEAREKARAQAVQIQRDFHRELWAPKLLEMLKSEVRRYG